MLRIISSEREVLFIAEPNYICPSRRKHTANFDAEAVAVKANLKKEIVKDVTEAGHKTINITSDHGTSSDQYRTKKNALTVARTTKEFVIKKDILKMITCEGSQTGQQIREDVKKALKEEAGWKEDWVVNWVTDNESKQVNARNPNKHQGVGMKPNLTGSCVDHTFELSTEETIEQCLPVKDSVHKLRSFVNHIKDSSTAKEIFHKILVEAGVDNMTIIQGTTNRWFFKYSETQRALLLKDHIDTYFDDNETPLTVERIEPEDWELILVYENSLRLVVEAAKVLEGELFPTASSVIPFLDTIFDDLKKLSDKLRGDSKQFVDKLLTNLQSARRFPLGYKETTPYNVLTLLDPRYSDLYYSPAEYQKAVNGLNIDKVYDNVLLFGDGERPPLPGQLPPDDAGQSGQGHPPLPPQPEDSFSRRRAQLLAAKQVPNQPRPPGPLPLKEKLKEELVRYLQMRGTVGTKENPNLWWRSNQTLFPLLAKYWMANSSFPATSTSAERSFSMDGLILIPTRTRLTPSRTGNMIVCRDYWLSREVNDSYKLCEQCPPLPSPCACYKISCMKHQKTL